MMLGARETRGEGALGLGDSTSVFIEPAINRGVPKALSVNLPLLLLTGQAATPNQLARNLGYVLPKLTSG